MNKKLLKELKEWGLLLAFFGILFVTGWYKDVAGFLQRGLLETGLMQPSTDTFSRPASYEFELVTMEGKSVPFSSFKGKTVFINFWATWCPPCIAEMPDIHDLYEKVGTEVDFVMISVDQDPQKAKAFIERKAFDFPVYFLKSSVPAAYKTSTIPSTYVISPGGEIVVEEQGLSKYDTSRFRKFLLGLVESEMSS